MAADPSTGTFSVVCWHRDPTLPRFSDADRALHERLLPHWMECFQMQRVGRVLRDLDSASVPGQLVALAEASGLIHYAQNGFGELLAEEFPGWPGSHLPAPVVSAIATGQPSFDGKHVMLGWRAAGQGLWLVHAQHQRRLALERSREAELRRLNATLDERDRREAVLNERQRILRELHDGLGSQLVGLRGLLRVGSQVTPDITAALEGAMDEMRLAVDSMQSPDDLATQLATLRWRLQPRLEAAGIELRWSIPEPDALAQASADLNAAAALQVQRVLTEAITNVLKHATARRVEVLLTVKADAKPGFVLCVDDDGIGPGDLNASRGVGVRSMHSRARGIGASLEIGPALPQAERPGTQVRLEWPGRHADQHAPVPRSADHG
jgi:signal transduction histidine kinase